MVDGTYLTCVWVLVCSSIPSFWFCYKVFSTSSIISRDCGGAGSCPAHAQLFLSFDVEATDGEHVKNLACIVCVLSTAVHVSQGFPEGRTFKLSLLQPVSCVLLSTVGASGGCCTSVRLNLLYKSLVLFIEHPDVSFETICLTLHVAIDFSPFVLLLA